MQSLVISCEVLMEISVKATLGWFINIYFFMQM